jgi:hypothetical protein
MPPSLDNLQQPRRNGNNSPKQRCYRTEYRRVRESVISFGDKSYLSAPIYHQAERLTSTDDWSESL